MNKKNTVIISTVLITVLVTVCLIFVLKPNANNENSQTETTETAVLETETSTETTTAVTEVQTETTTKTEVNKWVKDKNGKKFINEDGKEYKNQTVKIDGDYYKFDKNGYMVTGWSKGKNETKYFLESGKMATGWQYISKYKYYFDDDGKMVTDLRDKVKGPYLIKVNRSQNCVTVYAKDGDKGYIIPIKAFICSTGGDNTPLGTFTMQTQYRWRQLFGAHGQYCSRITGHILFHSIPYTESGNIYSMEEGEYNKLGTSASAGCVRLRLIDAKWIYDNCKTGKTTVTIYDDKNPGPFGKPALKKIPNDQTWDPTDPGVKK